MGVGRRTYCIALGAARTGLTHEAVWVFDASDNLYGTTYNGGIDNYGTVFELSPQNDGTWTENPMYSFNSNGVGGSLPWAGA